RVRKNELCAALETQTSTVARLSVLEELRDVAEGLGDPALIEQTVRQQLEAYLELEDEVGLGDAIDALRHILADRGAYEEMVELYERLSSQISSSEARAELLVEAARIAHTGLRSPPVAVRLVRRAVELAPRH